MLSFSSIQNSYVTSVNNPITISIPPNSKIEILKGKFVLGSGYKLKATSSNSSGNVDIIMGLLTDVT